jgi:hypothetical protein
MKGINNGTAERLVFKLNKIPALFFSKTGTKEEGITYGMIGEQGRSIICVLI